MFFSSSTSSLPLLTNFYRNILLRYFQPCLETLKFPSKREITFVKYIPKWISWTNSSSSKIDSIDNDPSLFSMKMRNTLNTRISSPDDNLQNFMKNIPNTRSRFSSKNVEDNKINNIYSTMRKTFSSRDKRSARNNPCTAV